MYKLLYEYEDFIVISKSQGIGFHNSDEEEGLCSYIKEMESFDILFPVHRLDKLTSGLLLFAKNKTAARGLSQLLQTREIEKYYIAISDKKPKKLQGLISGDMERGRRGGWKLLRTKANPANTRFFSKAYGRGMRLFVLKALTGKTHQLRVALKSIGAPVLGDPLYYRNESKKHDRGYLHAYALRFNYMGESYCFVNRPCEGKFFIENKFTTVLDNFKEPWLLKWPGVKG